MCATWQMQCRDIEDGMIECFLLLYQSMCSKMSSGGCFWHTSTINTMLVLCGRVTWPSK